MSDETDKYNVDVETAEQWELINTPLGDKRGEMSAETLEVYRICARLDSTNPLPIIRDRGAGQDWLKRMEFE